MNKITYKNILKQFDFLKFQISFSYKSNYLYKSAVGGFLTIINIVFILYFSIDNMINVLKKSNKYSILWNESEDLNTIIDSKDIEVEFIKMDDSSLLGAAAAGNYESVGARLRHLGFERS